MQIPSEWRALMHALQSVAPSALLAGGALRDHENCRPVKDLDVFVYGEREVQEAIRGMHAAGYSVTTTFAGDYVDAAKDVCFAYCARKEGTIDVNIIQLREPFSPLQCIERMDFGICQIAYIGGRDHLTTASYHHDIGHKVITMTRADSQAGFDWSMRRYERLAQKYPWPLVVPGDFECFQDCNVVKTNFDDGLEYLQ